MTETKSLPKRFVYALFFDGTTYACIEDTINRTGSRCCAAHNMLNLA